MSQYPPLQLQELAELERQIDFAKSKIHYWDSRKCERSGVMRRTWKKVLLEILKVYNESLDNIQPQPYHDKNNN